MFPPFVGSERRLSRLKKLNDLLGLDLALDDTHIGMLAEKPKNTKQYTATQMSASSQYMLDQARLFELQPVGRDG